VLCWLIENYFFLLLLLSSLFLFFFLHLMRIKKKSFSTSWLLSRASRCSHCLLSLFVGNHRNKKGVKDEKRLHYKCVCDIEREREKERKWEKAYMYEKHRHSYTFLIINYMSVFFQKIVRVKIFICNYFLFWSI